MIKRWLIAGKQYRYKAEVLREARRILAEHEEGVPITGDDGEWIHGLLDLHPDVDQKIGRGVVSVFVGRDARYNGRCFWLERVDGTKTDWSFHQCISPSSMDACKMRAFRLAVQEDLRAFKAQELSGGARICPDTGEDLGRLSHVDHVAPQTMESLIFQFLREEDIGLDDIMILGDRVDMSSGHSFCDRDLGARWVDFHRRHAVLELVSRTANLSIRRRSAQGESNA